MKKTMYALIAIMLILSLSCTFCSCASDAGGPSETTETVGMADTGFISPPPATTGADTTGTEAATVETEEPAAMEKVLSLVWNLGYVASNKHPTTPNRLISGPSGGYYSYTDVFVIESAGTTLKFTDANENDNGDGKFASVNAYVVSSWKKEGDDWTLNLSGANYTGTSADIMVSENGKATYTYTTSVDGEALRLCYRSGESSSFRPSAYPVVTAVHDNAKGTASDKLNLNLWIEESKKNADYTVLNGISVVAIGDSYFEGNGLPKEFVWLSLIAEKYGMNMNNYGKNGSTVSNYCTTCSPMCDRYSSINHPGAQVILIEGGRNDFNLKTPVGTVTDTDSKTYCGALNTIIAGFKNKNPDAMIVCITPWNFPGTNSDGKGYADYANAMRDVAQKQGVYCIYACDPDITGVDMSNYAFRSQYCMSSGDISHLNLEGMKIAMTNFEKVLAQYYTEFQSKSKG